MILLESLNENDSYCVNNTNQSKQVKLLILNKIKYNLNTIIKHNENCNCNITLTLQVHTIILIMQSIP